jgi:hypothetical protein
MVEASRINNTALIDYLISLGASNYDECFNTGCEYGHKDVVDYMIMMGARNYCRGLQLSRLHGQHEIETYLISLGATM